MKTILNFFTLFFIATLVHGQVDLKSNLYGDWKLDGDANESIKNEINGTLTDCVSQTDRFGNAESALSFNGSTSQVTFDQPLLPTDGSDWTLSVWFNSKLPSSYDQETIFEQYGWNETDKVNRFQIFVMNDSLRIFHGNYSKSFGVGKVIANQWYNIQVTCKDSTIIAYFECDEKVIGKIKRIQSTNSAIGFGSDNSSFYMTGDLDDFKIYTRALTPTELKYVKYELRSSVVDTIHVTVNDTVTVTKTVNDTVTVTVTEKVTVTDTLLITFNVAHVTPENKVSTIKVFPNPTSDLINITYDQEIVNSGMKLIIVNSIGSGVFSSNIDTKNETINVSDLGQGLFFIEIYDTNNSKIDSKKLLIE